MFDSAVAEPCTGSGDRLPTDDLVGLDAETQSADPASIRRWLAVASKSSP